MENCAHPLAEDVPSAELAAAIAQLEGPDRKVLVAVWPADRRAVRSIAAEATVMSLGDPIRPLAEAAAGVFSVPGRCVVLAQSAGDRWDWLALDGDVVPPPGRGEPPAAVITPRSVALARGFWLGAGARAGYPTIASLTATVQLGPLDLSAGATGLPLPTRDAWWRAGVLMALPGPVDGPAWRIGATAGTRHRVIGSVDHDRGPTFAFEVERLADPAPWSPRVATFLRCSAGVDVVVTPYAHVPGEHVGFSPVVELSYGVRLRPE